MDKLVTVTGRGVGTSGRMGFLSFAAPAPESSVDGGEKQNFCLFHANRIWLNGVKVKPCHFQSPKKFEQFFREQLMSKDLRADVRARDFGMGTYVTTTGLSILPTYFARCVWFGETPPPDVERLEEPAAGASSCAAQVAAGQHEKSQSALSDSSKNDSSRKDTLQEVNLPVDTAQENTSAQKDRSRENALQKDTSPADTLQKDTSQENDLPMDTSSTYAPPAKDANGAVYVVHCVMGDCLFQANFM